MEDSLFEMLMYLFHNYLERKIVNAASSGNLSIQLEHMELDPEKLESSHTGQEIYIKAPAADAMRLYAEPECDKISLTCRSFIIFIEQLGMLSTQERETIIQQLMESESTLITMDELKWTILEVLTPKMTLQQTQFLEAVLYPGSNEQRLH